MLICFLHMASDYSPQYPQCPWKIYNLFRIWYKEAPTYHVFRFCCHWAGQQCRQRLSVDLFPCTRPFLGVTSLPLLYSDAHLSRDFWICRQASFVFVWSIDLPVLVCVSADRQRLMGCPMTRHDFTQKCTHKKSFGAHLRQWDAKSEACLDSTQNWYVPEIVRSATTYTNKIYLVRL